VHLPAQNTQGPQILPTAKQTCSGEELRGVSPDGALALLDSL
jgi:hypothetical protein